MYSTCKILFVGVTKQQARIIVPVHHRMECCDHAEIVYAFQSVEKKEG